MYPLGKRPILHHNTLPKYKLLKMAREEYMLWIAIMQGRLKKTGVLFIAMKLFCSHVNCYQNSKKLLSIGKRFEHILFVFLAHLPRRKRYAAMYRAPFFPDQQER